MKTPLLIFLILIVLAAFYVAMSPREYFRCKSYQSDFGALWICANKRVSDKITVRWPLSLGRATETCYFVTNINLGLGIHLDFRSACE